MRALLALAALVFGAFRTPAQAPTHPADSTKASTATQSSGKDTALSHLSEQVAQRRTAGDKHLPDADNFTVGDRTIAEHTIVDGPIAVARGNLDVFGTVRGDVVTLDGDVRVHNGGRVTGDAWAAAGNVIINGGGMVDGAKRAIAATLPIPAAGPPAPPLTTLESIKLTIGWFALLVIIGLGVMVFADGNLDGVVIGLERGFGRSFWLGLAGELILLPALLVLVVALAITVLGILLIPFAIVAYVIAAAGLVTLGFLAVARLTGGAFASDRGTTSPRGVHLRALILGLVVYLGLWMLAAVFAWSPVAGAVLRTIAIAITWVAATVGLGAALTSRAGTVRPGVGGAKSATDELAWQTPTPVSGVAAATRKAVSTH
jgi:hypothetical protein